MFYIFPQFDTVKYKSATMICHKFQNMALFTYVLLKFVFLVIKNPIIGFICISF